MKKILLKLSLTSLLIVLFLLNSAGQITTSALQGRIVDENNNPLAGAAIVATHTPSGTTYGNLTNESGRFMINNMRVGGPYQVRISFIGYNSEVYSDIYLSLGNVSDINVTLKPAVTNLSEVIVSAGKSNIITPSRTGAANNISNEVVASVPSISRGLTDFTKISPLANTAGSGTSFAGASNRYNLWQSYK